MRSLQYGDIFVQGLDLKKKYFVCGTYPSHFGNHYLLAIAIDTQNLPIVYIGRSEAGEWEISKEFCFLRHATSIELSWHKFKPGPLEIPTENNKDVYEY